MIASVIVALFYVLGVLSAVNAAMTARTAQGATAWVVALVSFPFAAVPAYWVFGRSKFAGLAEAYEDHRDEIDALIGRIRGSVGACEVHFEQTLPAYEALRTLAGAGFSDRNRADLLIDGAATFDSIVDGIAAARDYVLVQFYIVRDDGLGRRLSDALIERAQSGVRVFLLYDEIGSSGLPANYIRTLEQAGVRVSAFGTRRGRGNRLQLNFRNHRKIVVVDGAAGWVGGHNVGDEYLGLDSNFSPWRDTHVRLEGPVVLRLQAVFAGDWYWATRTLPELAWTPRPASGAGVLALILPSAPTQKLETAGLGFVHALNTAKRRIWLTSPYFVPDEAVMKALELAALRGVDVRIVIPGKGDSPLVFLAAFHYIELLADLGIRFYEFRPGFLHAKTGLIDDEVSWIGTANFDNRSFRLNFEVMALIHDRSFAEGMERMFEADFAHSETLDPSSLGERNFFWRLGVSLARLFAPIL